MKNLWFDYLFIQGGKWHDYLFSGDGETANSVEKDLSPSAKQVIPFPSEIPVTAIEKNTPPVASVAREDESEQSAANAAS